MTHYQTRVVCFVDILGFKELIRKSAPNGVEDKKITDLISKSIGHINFYSDDNENYKNQGIDFQFTQFSDCFIISFEYTEPSQTFFTLLKLLWVQTELADKGIMCRGGIAIGQASHTHQQVFGPAVVEAYLMEQRADFPRIVAQKSILQIGAQNRSDSNSYHEEYQYLAKILQQDADGLYYVDYFKASQSELDDTGYEYPEYLYKLGKHIAMGLTHRDKKVRRKYRWMKKKYNELIADIKCVLKDKIRRHEEPELYDYYKGLSKIIEKRATL